LLRALPRGVSWAFAGDATVIVKIAATVIARTAKINAEDAEKGRRVGGEFFGRL